MKMYASLFLFASLSLCAMEYEVTKSKPLHPMVVQEINFLSRKIRVIDWFVEILTDGAPHGWHKLTKKKKQKALEKKVIFNGEKMTRLEIVNQRIQYIKGVLAGLNIAIDNAIAEGDMAQDGRTQGLGTDQDLAAALHSSSYRIKRLKQNKEHHQYLLNIYQGFIARADKEGVMPNAK